MLLDGINPVEQRRSIPGRRNRLTTTLSVAFMGFVGTGQKQSNIHIFDFSLAFQPRLALMTPHLFLAIFSLYYFLAL